MFVPYALIGIAITVVAYVLLRGSGLIRPGEKPKNVIGEAVAFSSLEGLGQDVTELPNARVAGYQDGHYRIMFDQPFKAKGSVSSEARISARHAGYPISRVGKSRFGMLAVHGQLDTGQQFVADLRRSET